MENNNKSKTINVLLPAETRPKSIFLLVICVIAAMLCIEAIVQVWSNRSNAQENSTILIAQVQNLLEDDENNDEAYLVTLKEEYIVQAHSVAYCLELNPDLLSNSQSLSELCELSQVDEISIFDSTGKITHSTVSSYVGITMNDGDQIGYFKPMLSNTDKEMCQDITQNTATGKEIMYAMVWSNNKDYLVQVGIEPSRLYSDMNDSTISDIVSDIPVTNNRKILVVDKESLEVLGSNDKDFVGENIGDLHVNIYDEDTHGKIFFTSCKGKYYYVVIKEYNDKYIAVIQDFKSANDDVLGTLLIVFIYLVIAAVIVLLITRHLVLIVRRDRKALRAQEQESFERLQRQLSIIQAVAGDCTDIMVLSPKTDMALMIKEHNVMNDYKNESEIPQIPVEEMWANYIQEYVVEEERENAKKAVVKDHVLKYVWEQGEYVYNCHVNIFGKVRNFSLKFVKVQLDDDDEPTVVASMRCIDDMLMQQERLEMLAKEAMTDSMTGFLNRRAFEENQLSNVNVPKEKNFVVASIDVNRLKWTNDNLGHAVGDELIVAAAAILKQCLGAYGQLYRVGGDEFVAVIFASERRVELLKEDIASTCRDWKIDNLDEISLACGFAAKRDNPRKNIRELYEIADKAMYEEKGKYYKQSGKDRRKR